MRDPKSGPRKRALGILVAAYCVMYSMHSSAHTPLVSGAFNGENKIDYIDLSLYDLAEYPVINSPNGGKPALTMLLGSPAPITLLILSLLLLTAGYLLKTGLFAVIGVFTAWIARQAVSRTLVLLESSTGERRFTVYTDYATTYLTLCWLVLFLSGLLAAQLTYMSYLSKLETGEDGVLDSVYAAQKTVIERYTKVVSKK